MIFLDTADASQLQIMGCFKLTILVGSCLLIEYRIVTVSVFFSLPFGEDRTGVQLTQQEHELYPY